jgi:hypothetical protein
MGLPRQAGTQAEGSEEAGERPGAHADGLARLQAGRGSVSLASPVATRLRKSLPSGERPRRRRAAGPDGSQASGYDAAVTQTKCAWTSWRTHWLGRPKAETHKRRLI